jgi:23S rRNA (uracil1939-C5)-methyltransferase
VHCPHAERCPGCALIGLGYPEQLEQKRGQVRAELARYPELAAAPLAATVPADPPVGYRVRAKLVADERALGLFERSAHQIVDIPDCLVLRPKLRTVAAALRARLPELAGASSIDLRETDAGVLVTLALSDAVAAAERERAGAVTAAASPEIVSVAISRREPDSPRVLGSTPEVVRGPTEARHTLEPGAPWHYASPGAFSQAHAGQAARLQSEIASALGPSLRGKRVLELYSGSGALGLRLARAGAELTLVENFPPAVALTERAAAEQAIRLRTLTSDAAPALERLRAGGERFDAVIVNPPRRGLDPRVRKGLAALAPERLLYVSCEPRTLARDAAHLALLGHALVRATPFDMIPLSDAVETLAVFHVAPPPPARLLHEDAAFLAVERVAHEPPESEPSGVAVFARDSAHARRLAPALGAARHEYIALARGILHPRGTLGRAAQDGGERTRYERIEVVAGHSLIRIAGSGAAPTAILKHLARIGHPVLGDARRGDARSNAHFEHRYGLDRAFFHRSALEFGWNERRVALRSELAPDLAAVLAALKPRVSAA